MIELAVLRQTVNMAGWHLQAVHGTVAIGRTVDMPLNLVWYIRGYNGFVLM
jgi:hypothetical protein